MESSKLINLAIKAKEFSYSPYSKFRVGAALLTGNDKIFTGSNIENASFGATCCAERTAVFKAVSEGENKIRAIAISSDKDDIIMPCGICRQVLAEFGNNDMLVICSRRDGSFEEYELGQLIPYTFELTKEEVL